MSEIVVFASQFVFQNSLGCYSKLNLSSELGYYSFPYKIKNIILHH